MAYTNRPGSRGDLLSCDSRIASAFADARTAYETGIEPALRCAESCAVCSVACLAWVSWDRGAKRFRPWPRLRTILPLETLPAKEDRTVARCCGKHLGCLSPKGRWRIAVRTKWQSGSGERQRSDSAFNGNGHPATDGSQRGNPTRPKPQDLLYLLPPIIWKALRRARCAHRADSAAAELLTRAVRDTMVLHDSPFVLHDSLAIIANGGAMWASRPTKGTGAPAGGGPLSSRRPLLLRSF